MLVYWGCSPPRNSEEQGGKPLRARTLGCPRNKLTQRSTPIVEGQEMLLRVAFQSCNIWCRAEQSSARAALTFRRGALHSGLRGFEKSVERDHSTLSKYSIQGATVAGMSTASPVRDAIQEKITAQLKPISLEVKDESSQHAGHAAMKGVSGGETHFRVTVVSQDFEGLTNVKRHKLIYQVLAEELAGPIHALSLNTKTPAEAGKL